MPSMLVALAIAGMAAGCGDGNSNTTTTTAGTPYPFSAKLDTAQELPKPKGAENASGTYLGTMTVGPDSGSLNWRLSLKGLSGPATTAQIHLGRPREVGIVAVTLCMPCAVNAHGSLGANAGLLHALAGSPTYINVATKHNPKGEIRGRIIVKQPVGASGASGNG